MQPHDLLHPTPAGLYCPIGDFYIDPVRKVERAVITHGHADHARSGHGAVLTTQATADMMRLRYGGKTAGSWQCPGYGETVDVGGVSVRLVPAGHVLGSAQVALSWRGMTIVVSGDYKRRRDPTCAGFEPVPCDVFVTEATFALPVFRHPDDRDEIAKLLQSVAAFPERCHVVGAYSLGKAQRVIALLREAGHDAPVFVHDVIAAMNALYGRHGVDLGDIRPVGAAATAELRGQVVVAPPVGTASDWAARLPAPLTAVASGWMGIRARARQRAAELPLVISDHADWHELTRTLLELHQAEIWVTHGREDALLHFLRQQGRQARALSVVGYGGEAEDGE